MKPGSPFGTDVRRGALDGVSIALGYLPVALAYGLLAKGVGLSLWATMGMSMAVYAGASQFLALTLLGEGAGTGSIVLLTLLLNARMTLMSAAIARRFSDRRGPMRALAAFGVTDETFAVLTLKQAALTPAYLLPLEFVPYAAWVGGSAAGYVVGDGLPASLKAGMGVALYALFIGLVVPAVRASRTASIATGLSMMLSALISRGIGKGSAIVLTALLVAGGMAAFGPQDDRAELTTSEEEAS